MRITVSSDADSIPFSNGIEQDRQDWWIESGGLTGLYGTPQTREKGEAKPQMDGDYWPSRLTQGGRIISMKCSTAARSSVEQRSRLTRLCDLMARPLTILVEDEGGMSSLTGYVADDIDPTVFFSRDRMWFTLLIYCPDPFRYGPWLEYPAANGVALVENTGNAPTWPVIHASGVSRLTCSLGDQAVIWQGSTAPLTLDFADMQPSQGLVTLDDAFAIPHGRSTVAVNIDTGSLSLFVRSCWK